MWSALQDGIVITEKMSDEDVYFRCQMFGAEAVIEALERFIEEFGKPDSRGRESEELLDITEQRAVGDAGTET